MTTGVGSDCQLGADRLLLNSSVSKATGWSGQEIVTPDGDRATVKRGSMGLTGSESNCVTVNAELLIRIRSINPENGNEPSHSAPIYKTRFVSASRVPPV